MKKIFSALTAVFIVLGGGLPAESDDLVLVSGVVKTVDGDIVQGLQMVMLRKDSSGVGGGVTVDKNGRFMAQMPAGEYKIQLSAKCLYAILQTKISQESNTLEIHLPRVKTYEFNFVNESADYVPSVLVSIGSIRYESPENTNFDEVSFVSTNRCFADSDKVAKTIKLLAFETQEESLNLYGTHKYYSYINALGQRIEGTLPSTGWKDGKFTIQINDLPQVKLNSKTIKVHGNQLSVKGLFHEVPVFTGIAPVRTFTRVFQVLKNGKWSKWDFFVGKVPLGKNNQVALKFNIYPYRGSTIRLGLVGKNFTAVNNYVQFKVPK